jgi:hypothetical protein
MIYPKCKQKHNQTPAIRYDGYVVPCCHFGGGGFEEIKYIVGDLLPQMHILNNTLDQINQSEAFQLIESSFSNNPMAQCIKMCSSPVDQTTSASNAKFIKRRL